MTLNNYIDQATDLITDIDIRFRVREIVINAWYDGRSEILKELKEGLDKLDERRIR